MKKHTLIVTLIAAALLGKASAYDPEPTQTPTPTPTPIVMGGCHKASWNPELYSFYGAKGTILKKIAQIPTKLSERRVFLQVTQGDSSAVRPSTVDIKLYEQQEDGTYTVTEWTNEWTKKQTSHLIAKIDGAICDNHGVNCVGEQVKAVLKRELGGGKAFPPAAAPETPEAAFKHSVDNASGEFIENHNNHSLLARVALASLDRLHFGTAEATSFWKRGSFRSESNIGSSRSSAGVSGRSCVANGPA